jgi:hypothetical protein
MPIKRRGCRTKSCETGHLSVAIQGEASVFFATDLRQQLPLATRDLLLLVVLRSTIDNDKCRVEMPQVG